MNADHIDDLLKHIKKASRQIKSHRGEEHISGVEGRADTRREKALVLALVLEIWDAYPDQRLGQLLSNVEGSLFHLEDQKALPRAFVAVLELHRRGNRRKRRQHQILQTEALRLMSQETHGFGGLGSRTGGKHSRKPRTLSEDEMIEEQLFETPAFDPDADDRKFLGGVAPLAEGNSRVVMLRMPTGTKRAFYEHTMSLPDADELFSLWKTEAPVTEAIMYKRSRSSEEWIVEKYIPAPKYR